LLAAHRNSGTALFVVVDGTTASDSCLELNGLHNVVVLCNGSITGSGSWVGITISNSSDIELHDCDVSNFSTGILISNSTNISFLSSKSHDNTNLDVQLAGDVSKSCQQGSWDLRATNGPLLLFTGNASSNGSIPVSSASAVWFMNANGYEVSATGSASPAGRIDPIFLFCNSNDVRLSGFSGSDAPRGLYLYHDTSSQISSISLSNVQSGVLSYDSNSSSLYDVQVSFSGDAIFSNPESFEWQNGVVFSN
jgi:hypothetical protein